MSKKLKAQEQKKYALDRCRGKQSRQSLAMILWSITQRAARIKAPERGRKSNPPALWQETPTHEA
jgi:hypothetical protein